MEISEKKELIYSINNIDYNVKAGNINYNDNISPRNYCIYLLPDKILNHIKDMNNVNNVWDCGIKNFKWVSGYDCFGLPFLEDLTFKKLKGKLKQCLNELQ